MQFGARENPGRYDNLDNDNDNDATGISYSLFPDCLISAITPPPTPGARRRFAPCSPTRAGGR
jgi:hypothetical protein